MFHEFELDDKEEYTYDLECFDYRNYYFTVILNTSKHIISDIYIENENSFYQFDDDMFIQIFTNKINSLSMYNEDGEELIINSVLIEGIRSIIENNHNGWSTIKINIESD